MILTVSRMDAEKSANPGYRAFLANGFNVDASASCSSSGRSCSSSRQRAAQSAVTCVPRGHRGGYYPLLRGALCVFVRDLIVYGVLRT